MTVHSKPFNRNSTQSRACKSRLRSGRNAMFLLARREISPRTKHLPKRRWREGPQWNANSSPVPKSEPTGDAKRGLISWVEAESFHRLSAKYSPLVPPPRSTIAAAFSPDGRTLASTHGDHTVKIIDCQTGNCLKVLLGHRRTPWVVRFHPRNPEVLASGSLDYEVRLWDANTSECIGSHNFCRPIASIAFHAEGELLAVASGHKLYVWHYNEKGEASSPAIVLKTRRSLRAVHFHPHGAPFLLTAEVNDLDSSDSSMTMATSPGYLKYPPPAVFVANAQSSDHVGLNTELPPIPYFSMDATGIDANGQAASNASIPLQRDGHATGQYDNILSMETFPSIPLNSDHGVGGTVTRGVSSSPDDAMEMDEMHPVGQNHLNSTNLESFYGSNNAAAGEIPHYMPVQHHSVEIGQLHQFLHSRELAWWELPFLQGWLSGQSQTGISSMLPLYGGTREHLIQYMRSLPPHPPTDSVEAGVASLTIPGNRSSQSGVSGSQHRVSRSLFSAPESGESAVSRDSTDDRTDPIVNRIQSEIATSLAAAAAAELPCTVKLRVWSHDIEHPCALLNAEKCRLTIPHAVLCSEMGAHFSPCGRYLAACVACTFPNIEAEPGLRTLFHQDTGDATSPTRHPVSVHQVMYELRVYSLEEATFGLVLVSRAIRAAHCLTSIQFSPTSEHILLAYGRRHGSLLKSIVIDGETTSPVYTVLEIYRVSDMELVSVLPSAEDEVNVACFHPFGGGGLVYGTKEGKLRFLSCDGASCGGPNFFPEDNLAEVQTYALEG